MSRDKVLEPGFGADRPDPMGVRPGSDVIGHFLPSHVQALAEVTVWGPGINVGMLGKWHVVSLRSLGHCERGRRVRNRHFPFPAPSSLRTECTSISQLFSGPQIKTSGASSWESLQAEGRKRRHLGFSSSVGDCPGECLGEWGRFCGSFNISTS